MKRGAFVVSASLLATSLLGTGCSRNRQEAVLLANKGDQEVKLNVDGAINSYDQATRLDPTNHRIFFKLGMAYRKKEDWDKVASTMARATSLAPKFANYWFERGYALEQQAKKKTVPWEEAKEPFQKCVENDPNYADCYFELANVFLWTDDEQKALENYNKAVEHEPTNITFYNALADLYMRLGHYKEAETVLKEAKGFIKPDDKAQAKAVFGTHVLLAGVYQEKDSFAESVTELEAAKASAPAEGPESITILYMLGSSYAKLKPPRSAEAISMLKGFSARACKGAKASSFKVECETSQTLVTSLGGTL
ncbi:TPR Domain containing protein [Minicystis rosea]|nr:TPR Domain containing protein [Minicystis rosea]